MLFQTDPDTKTLTKEHQTHVEVWGDHGQTDYVEDYFINIG